MIWQRGFTNPQKTTFKLFDFFANCEYFEEKFNYDEVLSSPGSRRQALWHRRAACDGRGRSVRASRRRHPGHAEGAADRRRRHEIDRMLSSRSSRTQCGE